MLQIFRKIPEAAVLASLFLLGVGFFSDGWWFASLVGFVPMLWFLDHATGKDRLLGALAFGAGYAFTLGLPFFSLETINSIPLSSRIWLLTRGGIALYLAVSGAVLGVSLWGVFMIAEKIFGARGALLKNIARLLALPVAMLLFERALVAVNEGAVWGLIGESLVPFSALRIFARVGGVFFLSFLVTFFNAALYEGVCHWRRHRLASPLFSGAYIAAVMLSAGMVVWSGGEILERGRREMGAGSRLSIAVVQPAYINLWSPLYYKGLQQRSSDILAHSSVSDVDLLIFPARHLDTLPREEVLSRGREIVEKVFGPVFLKAAYVMFDAELEDAGKTYPATVMVARDGEVTISPKEQFFIFSDKIPAPFIWIAPALRDYAPHYTLASHGKPIFMIGEVAGGGLVCNEGLLPQAAARLVDSGARFLVITGSNRDFSNPFIHRETLRAAQLRAVENNVLVVQAMKTGISAVVGPTGEVQAILEKDAAGILEYELHL